MLNESIHNNLFGDSDRAASVPDDFRRITSGGASTFNILLSEGTVDAQILKSVIQQDYLAKAYFLVCCHDSDSASSLPLLLRFEKDDLVIWKSRSGSLCYALGAIDTAESTCTNTASDERVTRAFKWKPDSRLITLAGEMLVAFEIAFQKLIFTFETKVLTVAPSCISLTDL